MFQNASSNETITLCIIKFFNVLVIPKLMPLNVIFKYAKNNYTSWETYSTRRDRCGTGGAGPVQLVKETIF